MGLLSKEGILGAQDLKTQVVEVPEWGGSVVVSEMTGTSRDSYEMEMAEKKGERIAFRAMLLARCLVGEDGQPLFSTEDVENLGKKSGAVLGRLWKVAVELNALGADKKKEVEKNSESGADGEPRSA